MIEGLKDVRKRHSEREIKDLFIVDMYSCEELLKHVKKEFNKNDKRSSKNRKNSKSSR